MILDTARTEAYTEYHGVFCIDNQVSVRSVSSLPSNF